MTQLRHDPFLLPGTRIRGFVLDITTFNLEEIDYDKSQSVPDAGRSDLVLEGANPGAAQDTRAGGIL